MRKSFHREDLLTAFQLTTAALGELENSRTGRERERRGDSEGDGDTRGGSGGWGGREGGQT